MYDLTYGHRFNASVKTLEFLYDQVHPVVTAPEQLDFEIEPGCLCIVSVCLQYIEKNFSGDVIITIRHLIPWQLLKQLWLTEKWIWSVLKIGKKSSLKLLNQ